MMKPRDLRNSILLIVLFFSGVVSAAAELPQKEENNWERVLYKGLHLYYQGEYLSSYELIENAVRSSKPGPEVHKCLALMQLSFIKMHNLDPFVLVRKLELSKSAVDAIGKLDAIKEPNDADQVVAATLKGAVVYRTEVKTILQRIIDSDSPWKDWAYWRKAQIVASELSGFREEINDLGVVEFTDSWGQLRQGCLVTTPGNPDKVFRGRAARIFLKKYPNTYMARQMEIDMLGEYLLDAFNAHVMLEGYCTNNKSCYLNEAQLSVIRENCQKFMKIGELLPKNVLDFSEAERGLEELLDTGVTLTGNDIILKYLKAVIGAKGKDALPESVYKWVLSS